MALAKHLSVLLALQTIGSLVFVANGLSMGYYIMSCPSAELVMRNVVTKAIRSDPTLAAALLRMHFHDCFVEGCDGSVLLDSTPDNKGEKDSPANLSLRGFEVIDDAKTQLEQRCPGVVSCADIIAFAAMAAIEETGGPVYILRYGRKDGRRSKIEDTFKLPSPTANASELVTMFSQRGFTAREMVALSGAHTLGMARCSSFKMRLNSNDSVTMLDSGFATQLSKTCALGDTAEQPLDITRNQFDNAYFRGLQQKSGVLFSDQTLFASESTAGIVNGYAANNAMFFIDFQQAMVKMGNLDVKEGPNGEVRKSCRKIN